MSKNTVKDGSPNTCPQAPTRHPGKPGRAALAGGRPFSAELSDFLQRRRRRCVLRKGLAAT